MAAVTEPLFCPFCGECFEDLESCPEHEIPLVTFAELGKVRAEDALADDAVVAPWDLRYGRGLVFGGAAILMGGFFAPFAQANYEGYETIATGLEVASGTAMNLWVVPAIGFTLASIVLRRRTPASMRGARLALPALAIVAAISVSYTLVRMFTGAEMLTNRLGRALEITPLLGPYFLLAGALIAVAGGLRLGISRGRPARYRVDASQDVG